MFGQHLDGDRAVEAGVDGFVDLTPGTEGGLYLVDSMKRLTPLGPW